jgi:glycine/D-amino acid oxidase-like deaminating enzyme
MGLPEDAVLHSTRHTMLTELGAAGADASTIQVIAGHEDIRTSQKYLHPTPQHVVMAFERMHSMRKQTEERERRQPRQTWKRVPTIFPTLTDREYQDVGKLLKTQYAKVAELADAPDLGSGG